jgi:hypothetical protein
MTSVAAAIAGDMTNIINPERQLSIDAKLDVQFERSGPLMV